MRLRTLFTGKTMHVPIFTGWALFAAFFAGLIFGRLVWG